MDARLHPAKFLGLSEGDAHVIRNAGGTRVGRRHPFADHLLAAARDPGVRGRAPHRLRHAHVLQRRPRGKLEAETGSDASGIDFLPFGDLEQSVRDDVAAIKASPFIDQDIPVRGFVYDVKTAR